jgi:uncharacterized protein YcfL
MNTMNMKRFIVLAFCFLLVFVSQPLNIGYAQDDNLIPTNIVNASFEDPLIDGEIPGWTQTTGTNGMELNNGLATDGSQSLTLIDSSASSSVTIQSDLFALDSGAGRYRVTADVYATTGGAQMYVYFYDQAGVELKNDNKYYTLTLNSWTTISMPADAPVEATSASIALYSSLGGISHVHYDNIQFSLQEQGVIFNSGFEALTADGKILGWTQTNGTSGITSDSTRAYKGNKSVKVDDPSASTTVALKSEMIPLAVGGGKYRLSAELYSERGGGQLYIYFYDEQGTELNVNNKYFTVPLNQWTSVSVQVDAPAGATQAAVMLYSSNGGISTVNYDNIQLLLLKNSTIFNSGFEQLAADGKLLGWTQTLGNGGIVADSSRAYQGNYSVKVDDSSTAASAGFRSDMIPIAAGGGNYRLTATAYSERGGAQLYLYFYDAQGVQLKDYNKYFSIKNDQWVLISMQGEAPAGATQAAVLLYSSTGGTSTINYDNIELSQMNYSATKVGTPLRTAAVSGADFGKGPNGEDWTYAVTNGSPAVFYVLNSHTGEAVYTHSLSGAGGAWTVAAAPNGSVYIGTFSNGGLYRWTPDNNQMENLGQPIAGESFIWSLKADQQGVIYGSTYPNGKVFRYDPVQDEVYDYGTMIAGQQYARNIDLWGNKLYVGIGTEQARLIELDPDTGDKREISLPASYQNETMIYDLDIWGDLLFARLTNIEDLLVYDLAAGEWVDTIVGVKGLAVSPPGPSGEVYMIRNNGILNAYDGQTGELTETPLGDLWSARDFGWITLEDYLYPGESLISIDYTGRLRIYNPATNHYRVLTSEIEGEPAVIQSIAAGPDGKIYSSGYPSGGLAVYDPSTDTNLRLPDGIGQAEGMLAHQGKLYLGVYPKANIFEYDPADSFDFGSNPKFLFSLKNYDQDRPFAWTSAGNEIVIGTVPDYGKLGGTMTFYNPATGVHVVHEGVVENQSIVSLAYKDGNIYGGTSIWGGLGSSSTEQDAKLFIWNQAGESKLWEGVPIPGEKVISGLTFDNEGYLWGLTSSKLFKFDIESKQVVLIKELYPFDWTGTAFAWKTGELYFSEDGLLYGRAVGNLFSFNPQTSVTETLAIDVSHLALDGQGDYYFARGTDLYKLARTVPYNNLSITEVNVIPDMLVQTGTPQNELALPRKVKVQLNDHTSLFVNVTWDSGTPSFMENEIGQYVFTGILSLPEGILNPNQSTAIVNVVVVTPTVEELTIINVEDFQHIRVTAGTLLNMLNLPQQATITLDDHTTLKVSVTWDGGTPAYKQNQAGEYTFSGTLSLPTDVLNDSQLKATVKVIVEASYVPGGNGSSSSDGTKINTEMDETDSNNSNPDTSNGPNIVLNDLAGHWAEISIKRAIEEGIIQGYPDQTFRPNNPISRAEFITMLVRALDLPGETDALTFTDEQKIGAWARTAVTAAVKAGIINGYQDGSFRPTSSITRSELAIILIRAQNLPVGESIATQFVDDKDIPNWARSYINAAVEQGLMVGSNGNRFLPNSTATRAEEVVTLLRIMDSLR